MKINSLKKADFIPAKQLFYTQKIGAYKEDELFNDLSKIHKLKNPFDYQMAFLKHNEIYHCFLTPISGLKKSSFCFPEPLIFQALFDENLIKESDFCVLNLYDKILYLYFYEEGKLSSFKKMQNFNHNDINFFLEQGRFNELLKHYGSKLILHYNLHSIKAYIPPNISYLNLDDLLNKNSLLKLSSYSIKHLDQNCNFIKHDRIKTPFYIKIILLFILSLMLGIIILLFKDFIKYKQNKSVQNQNLLIQEELFKLKEDKEELLKHIKDLNLTLLKNLSSSQEQNQLLSSINKELNSSKNKSFALKYILNWLNINQLKISYLKLDDLKIILIFSDKNHFKLAIKHLDLNLKILNKDEDKCKLTLKLEHE